MKILRRIAGGLFALSLLVVTAVPAKADIPLLYASGTLTATGSAAPVYLSGQSICSAVLSGTWAGTVLLQGSSDNGATYTTVPIFGTQTTTGTYSVNISRYTTRFKLSWTRSSGTLAYAISCSASIPPPSANSSGYQSAVQCDKTAMSASAITSATTTLIIDAVTGKNIYICFIETVTIGTQSAAFQQLVYGTKVTTDCDTGQTAIQPPLSSAATTGAVTNFIINTSFSSGIILNPAATQLCVVTTGSTINLKVFVIYAQL